MDHPERIAFARQQFLVRLERRDHHPVEREQQHDQEHRQGQPDGDEPARQRHEIVHALRVGRPPAWRCWRAHLVRPAPCCHARRCRPKYDTRIAASRNGTIAVAIAAPSPRLPPGIARWNDSVAIRCVAVERSAARQHVDQLEIGEREQHRERHHDGDDRRQQRQRHVAELLPRRRAVEARRFVVRRRDRLQAGEQRDRDERHAAPDVGGDRREPRVPTARRGNRCSRGSGPCAAAPS